MKKMIVLLLIVAAIPVGIYFADKHIPRRNIASDGSDPQNQSLGKDHDLSEASPEEFKKAFKYQVLKDASLQRSDTGPGVRLGLFILKNPDGNRVFVCDEYPTMDVIFAADGMAHSGEIPQMIVRGPCLTDSDQRHIEALPIPFAAILKSPPGTFEFKTNLPDSHEQVSVYFRNVTESWPNEWTWVGVKFYGKNPQDTLQINGYEVISVLGEPLTLKAKPNE